jgi:aspartate racemase
MKTVGIIGGIGPESTIEYYRQIIASYREQKPDGSYPSIILNSVNFKPLLDLILANKWSQVTQHLVGELEKLAKAGADFAVIAANTPHLVFDDIRRESSIPLISIVEATCEAAKALRLKRLGLFGTRFTMQARFYPDIFSREGIEGITLAVPDENEQSYIHDKYMNELIDGIILPETRERLLTIVEHMKERDDIQGLILGGTELSLILRDATARGIPVLDTTRIHVKAIVTELLSPP